MHEYQDYSLHADTLASASGRALGGIISKFKSLKNVGYKTFRKLFESCVEPIMDYGSGIWGKGKSYKDLDKVTNRALRYFLGVNRFTPIFGMQGDMAFIPSEINRAVSAVRLWNKINNMNDNRLTKKILLYDIIKEGSFSQNIQKIKF